MNVLVDSSVLIDVLRGREGRADLLERLVTRGSLLCSCDITLADTFLAALCIQHGVVLLTGNRKYFPMKDLVVWTQSDVPSA